VRAPIGSAVVEQFGAATTQWAQVRLAHAFTRNLTAA
jgi:hypothetical protein